LNKVGRNATDFVEIQPLVGFPEKLNFIEFFSKMGVLRTPILVPGTPPLGGGPGVRNPSNGGGYPPHWRVPGGVPPPLGGGTPRSPLRGDHKIELCYKRPGGETPNGVFGPKRGQNPPRNPPMGGFGGGTPPFGGGHPPPPIYTLYIYRVLMRFLQAASAACPENGFSLNL